MMDKSDEPKATPLEQTEFERQQEAWFENDCQGKIEDY